MSEKEKKRLAIVGGVILVALLIYWLTRKRGGNVVRQGGTLSPFEGADIQNVNFSRGGFTLPGLNLGNWQGLSAIGACCADCSGGPIRREAPQRVTSGPTFVFNEGARGANYYDYRTFNSAPVYDISRGQIRATAR